MRDFAINFRLEEVKPKKKPPSFFSKIVTFIILASLLYFFLTINSKQASSTSSSTEEVASQQKDESKSLESVSASLVSATSTPTSKERVLTTGLKQQIDRILGDDSQNYGVYVKNLKTAEIVEVNGDVEFPPASISKIPIAMLILKDVDKGIFSLDQKFTLLSKYKMYETDSMYYLPTNSKYTLKKYLEYLIEYSDNTAMIALEDFLGGVNKVNSRSKSELGITNYFRDPHSCTAHEVSKVLEQIYKGTFLSKDSNELLLYFMEHIGSWLQDRIPVGIPSNAGVTIAHKIGDITTEKGAETADAGIIYAKKTDYILVVVNKDIRISEGKANIVSISKAVYEYFEK